ncbi:MAG: NAD(P)-dependent oxidoreductase [Solirubrobacteraceae bacterium]|nr:NAD(P)-dependent oxidoreductase [Solirubrobacteraceae bacterium]
MRVLVAGASGAIGRPLVPQLLAAGHDVVGITRRDDRAAAIRATGADAVVLDVLDRGAVDRTVRELRPDVVVDQLTSLPEEYDLRRLDLLYGETNRVRRDGTGALLAAAEAHGVGRYLVQSIAFLYAPEGDRVQDEDGRPWTDAPEPMGEAIRIMVDNERRVIGSDRLVGLALRYGFFYGPGTYLAPGGSFERMTRRRMLPIVGRGTGLTSYVHVHDAASATVAAVERGGPGIYNVVDDEPAAQREWTPELARALGAGRPLRLPRWVARVAAGPLVAGMALEMRGADNARARQELRWEPALPSWREGFRTALDADPPR